MSFTLDVTPPEPPTTIDIKHDAVIAVYIPTRNRPDLCMATAMSWLKLAERPDKIKFLVGIDHDDIVSRKIGKQFPTHTFKRSTITCGGRVQELSMSMEADIYMAVVDYYFCLTLGWDRILRHMMHDNEILNMACLHDINSYNLTAVSKRWHELASPIEPTWFPFWFSDQWRLEMHSFVFNRPPTTTNMIKTAGKRERTQNLHDLDWWWGFFRALRPLRIQQAHNIAKEYGMAPESLESFKYSRIRQIENYGKVDKIIRRTFNTNQKALGETRPKSPKYMKAKANAEAYAAEHNLVIDWS